MTDNEAPWLRWLDRFLASLIVLFHSLALIDHYENIARGDFPRWVPIVVVLVAYVGAFLLYIRLRRYSTLWRNTARVFLVSATMMLILVCIPPKGVGAGPKVTTLIADLENYTNDQELLRSGPRKLLTIALEQSPRIVVVPQERIDETLRQMTMPPETLLTPETSREICTRQGVPTFVRWRITPSGNQYTLRAQIEDPANRAVLADTVVGPFPHDGLTAAIGKLGESLRKKLGDSILTVLRTTKPLPSATTKSLPALNAYFEAQGELAHQDYAAAKTRLLKALELDPDFALALVELGSLYDLEQDLPVAIGYITRAHELRDRLTAPEQVRVDEYYYWLVLNDHDRALNVVSEYLEKYPNDQERIGTLAYQADVLMKFDLAENADRRSLGPQPWGRLDAEHAFGLWLSQLSQDKFPSALDTAKEIEKDIPGLPVNPYMVFVSSLAGGEESSLEEQLSRMRAKGDIGTTLWLQGCLFAYRGKLQAALEYWAEYIQVESQKDPLERPIDLPTANLWVARVAWLRGKPADVVQYLDKLDHMEEVRDEHLAEAAKLYARVGNLAKSQNILDRLRSRLGARLTDQNLSMVRMLEGELELKRGDPASAFETLSSAASYRWRYSYWAVQDSLANAALASHHCNIARDVYQTLLDKKGFAFRCDRSDDWVIARLGLARAAECLGEKPSALQSYMQFEQLWQSGDSDSPLMTDAQTRSAALRQ